MALAFGQMRGVEVISPNPIGFSKVSAVIGPEKPKDIKHLS